jgi:hypothetical protein
MTRLLANLGLALMLAACAPPVAIDLRSALTRAAIDQSEDALLLAELPARALAATLAPRGERDGVVTWNTGQGQTLSFRGGVLVATRGLGDDLMSADVSGTLAALNGGPQSGYPRLLTFVDGTGRTEFRALLCDMGPPVADPVLSFGIGFPAVRREETCGTTGGIVTNRYWIGSDGIMRRAEQWVGPTLGTLATEQVTR